MKTQNNLNIESSGSQSNNSLFGFLKREWVITSRKLRRNTRLVCLGGYALLYLAANGSFEKFTDLINLIFYFFLMLLIPEAIVFLHRQVSKKSNSTLGVILSSVVGFFLGLFLTGLALFALFYGLMILIYS